jgi:hypothetical protein
MSGYAHHAIAYGLGERSKKTSNSSRQPIADEFCLLLTMHGRC